MFKDSYITYAMRTPIGKFGGALASIRPDDLIAHLLTHYQQQDRHPLEEIDDVFIGCTNQVGEDSRNVARMALLLANYPYQVPGMTLNRLCGSSLEGVISAASRITAGLGECFLAGGVESMSRAPYALSKSPTPFGRQQEIYDTAIGWRFSNPRLAERFPLLNMGQTAEEVAAKYPEITRQQQDAFALASHQKATAADFSSELVPVTVKTKKGDHQITVDESPRPDSSLEQLAKLRPAFSKQGGSVTAGNSSSINDGASLIAVVSKDFLQRHNLTPLARITGAGISALHPSQMGLGPIEATRKLSCNFNLPIDQFDLIELNEAFAIQSLACIKELQLNPEQVNLKGGAIALGHPLGCTGTRILTTLVHQLNNHQSARHGLATMCVGVGQGVALSITKE